MLFAQALRNASLLTSLLADHLTGSTISSPSSEKIRQQSRFLAEYKRQIKVGAVNNRVPFFPKTFSLAFPARDTLIVV
jgi:hypothetical protein